MSREPSAGPRGELGWPPGLAGAPDPARRERRPAWDLGSVEEIEPRRRLEDLTVVIPTLGRDILERTLLTIAHGRAWPAEVIVVDQGRREEIGSWIGALSALGPRVRHLPSSATGRAAGVNEGIRAAGTRFVAVTDDDCFPEPDWASAMAARLRERPEAIVTGRVEAAGQGPNLAVATSREEDLQTRPRLTFDRLSGGNMGVAAETYRRVGPLDEHPTVRTAEDGEWAYRALRAGVTILYAPEVVVRHHAWRKAEEREAQYRAYASSHGGFYGKYLRRGDLFVAARAAVHLLRSARRWVLGRLRGNREAMLQGGAYVRGLLPGMLRGMRRREEAGGNRR